MSDFPTEWYVHPILTTADRTDPKGRRIPGESRQLPPALMAPAQSVDPEGDRSAVLDTLAALYFHQLRVEATAGDRITIPAGEFMAGEWTVSGRPAQWPQGTTINLERR